MKMESGGIIALLENGGNKTKRRIEHGRSQGLFIAAVQVSYK